MARLWTPLCDVAPSSLRRRHVRGALSCPLTEALMQSTIQHAPDAQRSTMRRRLDHVRTAASLLASLIALAACGGATSPDGGTGNKVLPDTTTLAGTWKGNLDQTSGPNSYGAARITFVLRADSTFTAESDNPLYCSLINTRWTVSPQKQFTATGVDCTGTGITLVAGVAPLRLNGTWTATSGRAGTFTVGKE